uniref:Myelin basic protein n=1 Tax=Lepisosteus oculatus TaxID=7918 RepID=W5M8E6_LEPOC
VQADVNQNNGSSSESTAVTDSKGAEGQKNAWNDASTADPTAGRPHLVRLFSRDAPGREDNTFKDRPSESDELQTIQENGGTGSECSDCTEQEAEPQNISNMATASTSDQARHGSRRQRDTGLLDQLGRFFGGEKEGSRKGKSKSLHLEGSMRSSHLGSSPQRPPQQSGAHARPGDDNPVVHFFKTIVSPRTPPPPPKSKDTSLLWGADGQKQPVQPRFLEATRSPHKGHKDRRGEGQGTLSKIFKLVNYRSGALSPQISR